MIYDQSIRKRITLRTASESNIASVIACCTDNTGSAANTPSNTENHQNHSKNGVGVGQ